MTINEAVDELRQLKRQFREIEVSGDFRGEHVRAEWHTANYPSRAREGVLYLSAPTRPDSPPVMGFVNLTTSNSAMLPLSPGPGVKKNSRSGWHRL